MRLAVMVWNSSTTKAGSIFGVFDRNSPAQLPALSVAGHWADFRPDIAESQFPEADAAKKAIAKHGYYLVGAGATISEVFGQPRG